MPFRPPQGLVAFLSGRESDLRGVMACFRVLFPEPTPRRGVSLAGGTRKEQAGDGAAKRRSGFDYAISTFGAGMSAGAGSAGAGDLVDGTLAADGYEELMVASRRWQGLPPPRIQNPLIANGGGASSSSTSISSTELIGICRAATSS